jgi:hypothetical protein
MIRARQPVSEIVIDLNGPQGNAFYLLGFAQRLARQFGYNPQQVINEMQDGDYENLIQVFDNYFGGVVILER